MNNLSKLTRLTLHKALAPVIRDSTQRNLAVSSTTTGLKAVGFYWFLKVVGLDPSPLLAVFGMFGAAIGFAGKDMVSNFISGATLAASNTFKNGDILSVGSSGKGKLIDMDMKYLYLEQEDGTLLLIPNSSVTTSVVSIIGGANRKKIEAAYFDAQEAKESSENLNETPETRKAKNLLYTVFVFVPFMAFSTFVGFYACGFITDEDIKRWRSRGQKSPQQLREEANALEAAERKKNGGYTDGEKVSMGSLMGFFSGLNMMNQPKPKEEPVPQNVVAPTHHKLTDAINQIVDSAKPK